LAMTPDDALSALFAIGLPLLIFYRSILPKSIVKVTELWVYPVKSCKGTKADTLELTKYGFKGDREYMIVFESERDDIYHFLTQREHPKMALIEPKLVEGGLILKAPNTEDLFVTKVTDGPVHDVTHWAPEMKGIDQGDAAAEWLTRLIGKPCRLMIFPEKQFIRPSKANPHGIEGVTKFADAYPILVANEASLDAVNEKLPSKITMKHFRANIVIKGPSAWEENKWSKLETAAGNVFQVCLPCKRCTVPSVNPQTGERLSYDPRKGCKTGKDLGLKPEEEGAYFGQNLIFDGPDGTFLKVGDILSQKYR